jgi:hypothetical protein
MQFNKSLVLLNEDEKPQSLQKFKESIEQAKCIIIDIKSVQTLLLDMLYVYLYSIHSTRIQTYIDCIFEWIALL